MSSAVRASHNEREGPGVLISGFSALLFIPYSPECLEVEFSEVAGSVGCSPALKFTREASRGIIDRQKARASERRPKQR